VEEELHPLRRAVLLPLLAVRPHPLRRRRKRRKRSLTKM